MVILYNKKSEKSIYFLFFPETTINKGFQK